MFYKHKIWLVPLLLMAAVTPMTPWLDLKLARYFYEQGEGTVEHFVSHPLFEFLYVYALLPGQILLAAAAAALLLSYLVPRWKTWRPHALMLVLTLAIGAGFLINAVLKDHWGRPRPRQVVEFGGTQPFLPYYEPNFFNQPEESKSFPCGHCSMGFYFFSLTLIGIRFRKKWLIYSGLTLALLLGFGLGITRMAQGGHFFSDVLASALIMWLAAVFFDWLVYEDFA